MLKLIDTPKISYWFIILLLVYITTLTDFLFCFLFKGLNSSSLYVVKEIIYYFFLNILFGKVQVIRLILSKTEIL